MKSSHTEAGIVPMKITGTGCGACKEQRSLLVLDIYITIELGVNSVLNPPGTRRQSYEAIAISDQQCMEL